MRQTFVNWEPGENQVPSGTVTSVTNAALSHGVVLVGVNEAVGEGVADDVRVIVGDGVAVDVGVIVGAGVEAGSRKPFKVLSKVDLLSDARYSISVREKVRLLFMTAKVGAISNICLTGTN